MSRGLIATGVSVASCMGTVAVTLCSGDFKSLPCIAAVMGAVSSGIGLAVTKVFKEEGQSLDKKDIVVMGGAGVVGSLTGVASVAALVTAIYALALGSMLGISMGMYLGALVSLPLQMMSIFVPRPVINLGSNYS